VVFRGVQTLPQLNNEKFHLEFDRRVQVQIVWRECRLSGVADVCRSRILLQQLHDLLRFCQGLPFRPLAGLLLAQHPYRN